MKNASRRTAENEPGESTGRKRFRTSSAVDASLAKSSSAVNAASATTSPAVDAASATTSSAVDAASGTFVVLSPCYFLLFFTKNILHKDPKKLCKTNEILTRSDQNFITNLHAARKLGRHHDPLVALLLHQMRPRWAAF